MGKVIKKKIQGMNWQMKVSLVLLLTLVSMVFMYEGWYKPNQTLAAVASSTAGAILGSSTTNIAGLPAMSLAKPATTNRLLVVTFAGDYGTATTTFQPTITYGNQTLTRITSTDTTSRQKVWIGYLNDAGITAATTTSFAVSGVTPDGGCSLAAAFYDGVNQTIPVLGSRAVSSDTAATIPTSATITSAASGMGIYALNTNSTTAGNVTVPAGYTEDFDTANGSSFTFTQGDGATTGTTTNPLPTWTSVRYAFVAISLAQSTASTGLTIGNSATQPANVSAAPSSTNNAVDAFSMTMGSGTGTVTSLTVTGSASFTSANVPTNGVKIYRKVGTNLAALEGTDVLISNASSAISGNATTVTLTTAESVSTTAKNFLIVVDLTSTATATNFFTATISGAAGTGLGTVTDSDTTSGTLTVASNSTLTIGEGTNPSSANAPLSSTNNALDAFTLTASTGTGSVTALTITGNANFTATNIPTNGVKIWRDLGTVGVKDAADVQLSTASAAIAGNAVTITLTAAEAVTTTPVNYLVTIDITAGASTTNNTITGTVSAVTQTGFATVTDNDANSATLTVTPVQTLTVGNGTNPAAANIKQGTSAALDAFTLSVNTGSASVNSLTLTGSANFTTANIAGISVYADNGVIGTYQSGTDTLVSSTFSQTGTVATITFTSPESVTITAKNYLIVVTATSGAALQSFTGTISAASGTGIGTPAYTDTSSATLTIIAGPVSTINNCGGCHGYPGGSHSLNDGTSRANGLFFGTHSSHVYGPYNYACSVCHVAPATTTTADNIHSNGLIQMASPINSNLNAAYGKGSSWALTNTPAAFQTCNTTTCHGQKSPVWGYVGNSNSCLKCHGVLTGTFTTYSAANIAPGGSGQDTGGNTATTAPRVGTHQNHLLAQSQMSPAVRCNECHTVHGSVNDATHLGYTTARINFGTLSKTPMNNTTSHRPVATRTSGIINCSNVYCHHGKRPDGTAANKRGTITTTWAFNGTNILDNTTISGSCANKCHGMPPGSGVAGDTHQSYAVVTTVSGLSTCSNQNNGTLGTGCHPTIKSRAAGLTNFTNMTSIFVGQGAQHINGIVEGGTCTSCHKDVKGNRRDVANDFNDNGNSHHYQSTAALDGKVCYACHWEADASGGKTAYHGESAASVVDLVVWGTSITRPTNYATNSVTYLSGGAAASSRTELAKINTHCIGCHNETNKATQNIFGTAYTSTPAKYSWEALPANKGGLGLTAQSIDAKYSDPSTTLWGKFSGNFTNAKNGQTKAFSAHGNAAANQRGWNTTAETAQGAAVANYPNTSGTGQVLCFDCHNSHGSETTQQANAITTSYSSATGKGRGGLLKTTVAGQGGYTVTYRSYTGGNATQKNSYKNGAGLCFDCHNNSAAGSSTSTGYTSPWGYGVFGATQLIHGFNDNPYFGKAGGTFAKGVAYPYIAGLTNKGGHFGASSPLATTTNNNLKIGGICTPCHDPHGVSPGIATANRQYAVPMLKETFVTSPYKQDAAALNAVSRGGSAAGTLAQAGVAGYHIDQNTLQAATTNAATGISWNFATSANTLNTLTDTQFAGLCMKCHAKTSLQNTAAASTTNWKTMTRIHNSVKGWATTGGVNVGNAVHAYTCSKCHSTHNSMLPRLMVTNCLDARHKNRSATVVTPTAAIIGPFSGSNGSGNGLGRFPGGGSYAISAQRATNPGPWFFGQAGTAATQTCHDTATAGGTNFDAAGVSQQWNTKTLW